LEELPAAAAPPPPVSFSLSLWKKIL